MTVRLGEGADLHVADSTATPGSPKSRLWISGDTDAGRVRFGNNPAGLTPRLLTETRLKSDPRVLFKELDADGYLVALAPKVVRTIQISARVIPSERGDCRVLS